MDFTSNFSFNRCRPQLSASGAYISYIYGSKLIIRYTKSLASKCIIQLPTDFAQNVILIQWDKCLKHSPEQRLAVATRHEIRTFSISKTTAIGKSMDIDKSSGNSVILPGKDEIVNVEWLSADTPAGNSQIVRLAVFTKYHLDVKIWSSNGVEMQIQSPKFSRLVNNSPILCLDGLSNRFSILSRFTTSDVLYHCRIDGTDAESEIIIPLNKALDVIDLKWSPSALWLAAIDSPLTGYNVYLWSADGTFLNSYKDSQITYSKEKDFPPIPSAASPTCLEWLNVYNDPGKKDFELLLVGDSENKVCILDLKTFQPCCVLFHGSVYEDCCLWEEYLSPSSHQFEYRMVRLPFIFSSDRNPVNDRKFNDSTRKATQGVISMDISDNSQLLATRLESAPQTVWIWSLADIRKPEILAIISHTCPIKAIQWKPESTNGSLLITPSDGKIVGIWDYDNQLEPKILDLNANFESPLIGTTVLGRASDVDNVGDSDNLSLLVWSKDSFSIGGRIDDESDNEREELRREQQSNRRPGQQRHRQLLRPNLLLNPVLPQDEDTQVKLLADLVQQSEWIQDSSINVPLEDTFHNKLKY